MIRKICFLLVVLLSSSTLFALSLRQVAGGLDKPIALAHAGDGTRRLFIVEQSGRIKIFSGSQVLGTPFLNIVALIACCGERGLLSVAFHPNYETNGFFFVNYTDLNGNIVIARYTVSSTNPNVANASSAKVLLTIPHPDFSNHNGGQLQFGKDGFLYISVGDGGGGGDTRNNAQNLNTLLGKILRIDVNQGNPYAIPPSNPFVSTTGARKEIWAYGLRNPWRISFDRQNGDLFIADVGQGDWEEVNLQNGTSKGGNNYGWRRMEGKHCFNPATGCNTGSLKLPILEYGHGSGDCSITGGYRYRGSVLTGGIKGKYFYGDFCSGKIWKGSRNNTTGKWTGTVIMDTDHLISSFGEDETGELYVLNHGGTLLKFVN